MALSDAGKNIMLDALAASAAYVSLHTADPGTTGASEATGGSPAYARQALTWPAASAGAISAAEVTFDIPAGTYTHWGLWDAVSAGAFLGGEALSQSETYGAQGTLDLTDTVSI